MGASSSSAGTTSTNQAQNSLAAMQYGTATGQNTAQNQATASSSATGPSALAQQYMANGAAPISASAIQNYTNPYANDVISSTMAQLGQSQAAQTAQGAGNAIAGNALGGGRDAMSRAMLAGQQNLATGATLANLNANNYSQGLSAAQQDAARQMQAAGMAGTQAQQQGVAQTQGQTMGTTTGSTASGSTSQGAGTGASQSQTSTNPGALAMAGLGMSMMGGSAGGGGVRKEDAAALKGLGALLNHPAVKQLVDDQRSSLASGGSSTGESNTGYTGDSGFDEGYTSFTQLLNRVNKMHHQPLNIDPHNPHGSQQAIIDQYQKQHQSQNDSGDYIPPENDGSSQGYDDGGNTSSDDPNKVHYLLESISEEEIINLRRKNILNQIL